MRLLALSALVVLTTACRTDASDLDEDGDTFVAADDCDDADPSVNPGAAELCDGIDNNCDGTVDEASATDASTWYVDADGDGHGVEAGSSTACEAPDGTAATADDCDDADATAYPGGVETCDDVDNDCNGTVDDAATDVETFYADTDADTYGDPTASVDECAAPDGYVADNTDCDDADATINPAGTEVCGGTDENCDGTTDEPSASDAPLWYADADADSYGDAATGETACTQPSGFVADSTDCDDTSNQALPGGSEVCDGLDNDCEGTVDDNATDAQQWYVDADGDGYGDDNDMVEACDAPSGYVNNDEDCDDDDANNFDDCCGGTLTEVGSPTIHFSRGGQYGSWGPDPLETLGPDKYWFLNNFNAATAVIQYNSLNDAINDTNSEQFTLPVGWDGSGSEVYDGYLYYPETNSNRVIKYDIANRTQVGTLTVPDAGVRNTYPYDWFGYSDLDLAVDEEGLWVIYGTAANNGRVVISKIDEETLTITDTWNTDSDPKRQLGNGWMTCGVFYVTGTFNGTSTTVEYAFDTHDSSSWEPNIPFEKASTYGTQISYDPSTQLLYSWDNANQATQSITFE